MAAVPCFEQADTGHSDPSKFSQILVWQIKHSLEQLGSLNIGLSEGWPLSKFLQSGCADAISNCNIKTKLNKNRLIIFDIVPTIMYVNWIFEKR